MNVVDYFKKQPEKPIDALIEELQDNDVPITLAKRPIDKSEGEALIDRILNAKDTNDLYLPT